MRKSPSKLLKSLLGRLKMNENGLIPAIAQQYNTHEVLMMAWMNAEAIAETLETGRVCYWSRSRQKIWRKGEQSGQTQTLKEFRFDCDADTLLLLVDQKGVACHTGRRSCFHNAIGEDGLSVISEPEVSPDHLYGQNDADAG